MKYLRMGVFVTMLVYGSCEEVDADQLRCLVCQKTLEEFDIAVQAIDPTRTEEIGGYRLDSQGNMVHKTISQSRSEIHLSELADSICNKMDDYVRAKWKSNGQLTVLRLIDPVGGMNPAISEVDIIQDGDLNKSLKYYCEGILEEWEDSIIRHYQNNSDHIDIRVCSDEAKLCSHTIPEPDEEVRDEL